MNVLFTQFANTTWCWFWNVIRHLNVVDKTIVHSFMFQITHLKGVQYQMLNSERIRT